MALHTPTCVSVLNQQLSLMQIKNYKTYVKREIQNQSSLRHPLIVCIREVSIILITT